MHVAYYKYCNLIDAATVMVVGKCYTGQAPLTLGAV